MAQQGLKTETPVESERPAGLQRAKTAQVVKNGDNGAAASAASRVVKQPAPKPESKPESKSTASAPSAAAAAKTPSKTAPAAEQDLAGGDTIAAMIRANQALVEGMTAMQREILEFGSARLREDLKTQEEMSHCTDMQEAFRLQADFAQDAMRHYAEQTAKLIELSNKISKDCWGPLEDVTRAAFETAAKR